MIEELNMCIIYIFVDSNLWVRMDKKTAKLLHSCWTNTTDEKTVLDQINGGRFEMLLQ